MKKLFFMSALFINLSHAMELHEPRLMQELLATPGAVVEEVQPQRIDDATLLADGREWVDLSTLTDDQIDRWANSGGVNENDENANGGLIGAR